MVKIAVVNDAKIEQDVFTVIRTLIVANRPTYNRTISGTETTFTYTFLSAYPKDNPSFPIIVMDETNVNVVLLNLDGSGEDYGVEVQLDFYAKEAHGKKAISEGRDPLRKKFIDNRSTFDTSNGLIPMEDFLG